MPTTKHELLDWLMDVPEDAEIGTDGAGLALLAILGTNVHLLEVGHIPNADELYAEAINQAMLERLRRIDAAGGETETGIIIVTFQGYISGIPRLFSTDFNTAFIFKNREQAEAFITEFAEELYNPQILDTGNATRIMCLEFFLGRRQYAPIIHTVQLLHRHPQIFRDGN